MMSFPSPRFAKIGTVAAALSVAGAGQAAPTYNAPPFPPPAEPAQAKEKNPLTTFVNAPEQEDLRRFLTIALNKIFNKEGRLDASPEKTWENLKYTFKDNKVTFIFLIDYGSHFADWMNSFVADCKTGKPPEEAFKNFCPGEIYYWVSQGNRPAKKVVVWEPAIVKAVSREDVKEAFSNDKEFRGIADDAAIAKYGKGASWKIFDHRNYGTLAQIVKDGNVVAEFNFGSQENFGNFVIKAKELGDWNMAMEWFDLSWKNAPKKDGGTLAMKVKQFNRFSRGAPIPQLAA